jgi:hypothetical protein
MQTDSMFDKRVINSFGVASLLLSLSFWFALLPKSVPGVRLIHWGIGTHMALWGVAFLLSLVPILKGSRWWIVAMILPFLNLIFVVFIIGVGEWMASRPG